MSLTELSEKIKKCKRCRLWRSAKNAVPGEGSLHAKIMLVGQNPGKEENQTGRPFVGRAGKFLNSVLNKSGIDRDELFITNVVKHKTPNNRTPKPDEIQACLPHLTCQIDIIKPEMIVLMGAVAWKVPRTQCIMYVETYHPSAAMRFPKMRKKFEEDFSALRKRL